MARPSSAHMFSERFVSCRERRLPWSSQHRSARTYRAVVLAHRETHCRNPLGAPVNGKNRIPPLRCHTPAPGLVCRRIST
jgi:hypothetical protein